MHFKIRDNCATPNLERLQLYFGETDDGYKGGSMDLSAINIILWLVKAIILTESSSFTPLYSRCAGMKESFFHCCSTFLYLTYSFWLNYLSRLHILHIFQIKRQPISCCFKNYTKHMLLFCPFWYCTVICCINRFISLCKNLFNL